MRTLGVIVVIAALTPFVGAASDGNSSQRPGFPVLTGVLVDGSGRPTAGQVWVFFSIPALRSTQGAVQAPLLASARAGSRGRFVVLSSRLRFLPVKASTSTISQVERGIKANGGWANLDLLATDGKTTLYRALARHVSTGAPFRFLSGTGRLDIGRVVVSPNVPGAMHIRRHTASATSTTSGPPPIPCIETTSAIGQPILRRTVIGELHAAADSSETFAMSHTADSEIDVGFDYDGKLSLRGDYHVANSTGTTDTWTSLRANGRKLLTVFEYQRYLHRSIGGCGDTMFTTTSATKWDGGSAIGPPIADPSNRCTKAPYSKWRLPVDPGTSWSRMTSHAAKFQDAVSLFGFHLGASSGYSSSVSLEFDPGRTHEHYFVCGNDAPPGRSQRVFSGFTG